MSLADLEKRKLEEQAAKVFSHWYTKHFAQPMQFEHLNSPSKPDVTCTIGGQKLDLEIAHLYGSQQEAMQILGKNLDDKTINELLELEKSSCTQTRLLNALNRILYNKAQKSYDSDRVWLVIRNAHPAWRSKDIQRHCEQIKLAHKHPFEQIWIIGDWRGISGAVKIFPHSTNTSR